AAGLPSRTMRAALPAFTVGRRPAEAARAAGFADVRSADGDKADLAALLRAEYEAAPGPLLYLAGEDRAGELDLAASGIAVVTAVIYRAAAAKRFPDALAAPLAVGAIDGALHFSRRRAAAHIPCARPAHPVSRALAPLPLC